MNSILSALHSFLVDIGPVFILLGLLIFVHELGHFLVAKFFGVRVEVFSLGFGRKIFSFKRGETTYCISAIPIGGYVKMFGDDPTAELPEADKPYAFLHKPLPQRFAVVLAGPLMNLIFAAFLFTFIAWHGEDLPGPYVGDVATATQAYSNGFRSGDKVLKVDGQPTPTWVQVQDRIADAGGKSLTFSVLHEGAAQPVQLHAQVGRIKNENIFTFQKKVGHIEGLTQDSRSTVVGVKSSKSAAGTAGIHPLDLITSIDGVKVSYWRDLNPMLQAALKKNAKILTVGLTSISDAATLKHVHTAQIPVNAAWLKSDDLVSRLGLEKAELYIYKVEKNSPAEQAGIQPGDKVIRVNGQDIHGWSDIVNSVKQFKPSESTMKFTIMRNDREITLDIRPHMTELPMNLQGTQPKRFTIGILSGFFPIGAEPIYYRPDGLIQVLKQGTIETARWCEIVTMTFVRLVQGQVSARNLGGVITIGRVASNSFAAGLAAFLRTMGFISINLFLINLFPIPVLDGGHLLFYSIEALQGAPLSLRKMEVAQQVGLTLLMFLMAFALYNDIANLFTKPW